MSMETLMFYILSVVTVGSAVFVVLLRRPVYNVLFMILTMIGLAGFFILLRAEFVAMVQLIVYAGAIMVLFLFVIMLLNIDQIRPPVQARDIRWWAGALIAFALFGLILVVIKGIVLPAMETAVVAGQSNTELVAKELFTTYLLPFEIASVLLLAAIIGTVVLIRKQS